MNSKDSEKSRSTGSSGSSGGSGGSGSSGAKKPTSGKGAKNKKKKKSLRVRIGRRLRSLGSGKKPAGSGKKPAESAKKSPEPAEKSGSDGKNPAKSPKKAFRARKKSDSGKNSRALTAKKDLTPEKAGGKPVPVKKKRFVYRRMTQNEVENLFTLPPDDDVFEEETRLVTNRYYLTLSTRFRFATWITVIVLGAYLVGMFLAFRDEITLDNFRFLMRNVNFRLESTLPLPKDQSGVIYDRDQDRVFALYKEYFATVGGGRLTVCDENGNQSYSGALSYADPVLRSSDSQLLCFDRGGREYGLYTYFNCVQEGNLDYPITDGVISDGGIFALATREENYYGSVMVYDGQDRLIQRIRKDKYIVSLDLLPDGSQILVTSFYTGENGQPITEIAAHPTSSTEAESILTFENVLPYECRYLDEGGCVFVGSDGVKFIDSKWKIYSTSTFSGQNVIKYVTGGGSVALLSCLDSDTTDLILTRIDSDGGGRRLSMVGDLPVLCEADGQICVCVGGNLTILPKEGDPITLEDVGRPQAILWDGERFWLCMNTRVIRVFPDGRIEAVGKSDEEQEQES